MSDDVKKRIVKNSFWSLMSSTINRFGTLIFTILLARFLMPENYGLYSIVFSTAMIFYTFADLGINQALTRYVSFAMVKEKKKVASYYRYLLKLKLQVSVGVTFIMLLLAYPLSFYLFKNPALFLPMIAASFYIFILALELFFTSAFYAIEATKYISIKEVLNQTLRIAGVTLVFYFVASSYQVLGIYIALAIISLFAALLTVYYLRKILPVIYKGKTYPLDKKRIIRFIGFLTLGGISSVFFSYIDSIMLGVFVPSSYVGYYRAAFSLVTGIIGLVSFPAAVLLPFFTKLEKNRASRLFNLSIKYTALITIPASFGLLILGKYFIKLFYGSAYLPSALPLYFLAFLIFPTVAVSLSLSLFSSEEKPEIFAKLIVITSILNIVLNLVLIKWLLTYSAEWATAGAAIATLFSWVFYYFAAFYIAKKRVGVSANLKSIINSVIASLVMSGFLLLTLRQIKDMNLFFGIIESLGGMIVYFLVLFLMGELKRSDLNIIKILIQR